MGSSRLVYQTIYTLFDQLRKTMPLGKWQALNLALLSFGIVQARCCTLSIVAEKLWVFGLFGKADSIERRIQRFLSNSKVGVQQCAVSWSMEVIGQLVSNQAKELVLLVDETKLSDHLSIMMVALAYRKRAIPLVWRCYRPGEWPCSQLELVSNMLTTIAKAIPAGMIPLVQADQGLGTSPELVRHIEALGWHYLFRVQGQTRFYAHAQGEQQSQARPLSTVCGRGKRWKSRGRVFKKAGWIECWAQVIWSKQFEEGWYLITNRAELDGQLYRVRVWQEEAFRDLKSGGWQWQRSHVWQPEHAQRLVLALAVAYVLVLSLGTAVIRAGSSLKKQVTRGRATRYGVLRLGMRYLAYLFSAGKPVPIPITFFLVPHLPFC
jgi:Transposase DDE domain